MVFFPTSAGAAEIIPMDEEDRVAVIDPGRRVCALVMKADLTRVVSSITAATAGGGDIVPRRTARRLRPESTSSAPRRRRSNAATAKITGFTGAKIV